MKVLISTDIEGVAGVFHAEQTRPGNGEYERARRLMAAEASAAVDGAFEAGATEVWVNDSHGHFRNMPPELVDARARLVQGKPRLLGMMAGLEQGADAAMLVGWHARAQAPGILAHTVNSFAFARIVVNGVEASEASLYGALAGERRVPVVMASGDDAFVAEHRALFPHTEFVQTKQATGHASGISLSPEDACRAIRAGAAAGLRRRDAIAPLKQSTPMSAHIHTQSPAMADLFAILPGIERVGASEVAFEAATAEAAVRTINALSAMSAALR